MWRSRSHLPSTLRPALAQLPPAFRHAAAYHLGVHPLLADLGHLAQLRAAAEASPAAAAAPRGGLLSIEPYTAAERVLVRARSPSKARWGHSFVTPPTTLAAARHRRVMSCAPSAPRRTSCRPTRRRPYRWCGTPQLACCRMWGRQTHLARHASLRQVGPAPPAELVSRFARAGAAIVALRRGPEGAIVHRRDAGGCMRMR